MLWNINVLLRSSVFVFLVCDKIILAHWCQTSAMPRLERLFQVSTALSSNGTIVQYLQFSSYRWVSFYRSSIGRHFSSIVSAFNVFISCCDGVCMVGFSDNFPQVLGLSLDARVIIEVSINSWKLIILKLMGVR